MRRKMISLLLAGMMVVGLLAGCGSNDSEEGTESLVQTEVESESEEETEIVAIKEWSQEYDTDVYVAAVDGLSEDFIMGMDISSLLAEEASGVVYYNEDGEEADLLEILADAGVNYVRVRVWNDPYDENGKGYGGGNCDAETAAEIGARAAEYGIKLLVDFHYSDFWADPNKQFCPKDWEDMTIDEKAEALKEYTIESLNTIIEAGADVGMVQIGNEINYGLAGETSTANIMTLLAAGSEAVRSVDSDIQIVVHYTEIDNPSKTIEHAQNLEDAGIDYDIFGVSYYTYWHGTLENMQEVLTEIEDTFGVQTCIMETAAPYTDDDGDCSGNSVAGSADTWAEYPATVQGQASCIRDVIEAASNAGAIGIFYWEGAWVPVGSDYETNSLIWERYGSGWASSYAAEYDPDDAGQYYGGSSWDNQAFFDFSGKALASLNVFNYVYTGHEIDLEVVSYPSPEYEIGLNEEVVMPDTVDVVYNDSTNKDGMAVTWDEDQVAAIDTSAPGSYTVDGVLADGTAVTATVEVAAINLLENPGFEEEDVSMWDVAYLTSDTSQTDIQTKASDALSGEKAFHFWSETEVGFTVEQTIEGLSEGSYTAVTNIQGGDMGSNAEIYMYVIADGETYTSETITLSGWVQWVETTLADIPVSEGGSITVGMSVSGAAGGWGTIDDLVLYHQ